MHLSELPEERGPGSDPEVHILFVCGTNLAASPVAATLLGRRLADLGVPAVVRSAGLEQRGARPPGPVLQVLRARGLELSGHKSLALNVQLLGEADLVLGMARQHVEAAAHLAPNVWPSTFSLKEIVSYDRPVPGRRPEESLRGFVARVHEARSQATARSAGGPPDSGDAGDYVSDQMGYSHEACERMTDELSRLIDRTVAFLWPGSLSAARSVSRVFDDAMA